MATGEALPIHNSLQPILAGKVATLQAIGSLDFQTHTVLPMSVEVQRDIAHWSDKLKGPEGTWASWGCSPISSYYLLQVSRDVRGGWARP
jgi:hypothetical protein